LPAALVLATAFEWTRAATSARVDMTLAAALAAVIAGWSLAFQRGARWNVLAAAGAALGTLAKGPVALVLPALAAAGLALAERSLAPVRRLRPVAVLGIAAALAGSWYGIALWQEGGAFAGVVARENWQRFLAGDDHVHGAGYLVPLVLVGLLPWTPILPLALVPLRRTLRRPETRLAASWVLSGFVFYSLAAAKRSVYLLSLYPAVALLLAAGVAAPPAEDRLARAARFGATLYMPGGVVLAAVAALLAAGVDASAPLRPWLRPADAAGAAVVVSAAQAAAPLLGALAVLTAVAAVLVGRAARRARWRTVVLTVAWLAVLWTAAFQSAVHPAIARTRSLRAFLTQVDTLVPKETSLYVVFPVDPGLLFYAPRPVSRWKLADAPAGARVLLWEDELAALQASGRARLDVLARSEAQQGRRGRLTLVALMRAQNG
jgi:hypothetical protein